MTYSRQVSDRDEELVHYIISGRHATYKVIIQFFDRPALCFRNPLFPSFPSLNAVNYSIIWSYTRRSPATSAQYRKTKKKFRKSLRDIDAAHPRSESCNGVSEMSVGSIRISVCELNASRLLIVWRLTAIWKIRIFIQESWGIGRGIPPKTECGQGLVIKGEIVESRWGLNKTRVPTGHWCAV